jgi:hypothetical protein
MVEKKRRRVFAKFERVVAPKWVRELDVVKTLRMDQRPSNVLRENWLAYYDLSGDAQRNGWNAEEQAAIVERLNRTEGAIPVERPKLSPPWPAYDKLTVHGRRTAAIVAEKIAETVKENGYDPAYVIAYETENANREEVIAAVAATVDVEETEDEPLITA